MKAQHKAERLLLVYLLEITALLIEQKATDEQVSEGLHKWLAIAHDNNFSAAWNVMMIYKLTTHKDNDYREMGQRLWDAISPALPKWQDEDNLASE